MFNQLTHSKFMKALAELAVFLQLGALFFAPKAVSSLDDVAGRNWSWFSCLCTAVEATNALFKRQPFSSSFTESVGMEYAVGLVSV